MKQSRGMQFSSLQLFTLFINKWQRQEIDYFAASSLSQLLINIATLDAAEQNEERKKRRALFFLHSIRVSFMECYPVGIHLCLLNTCRHVFPYPLLSLCLLWQQSTFYSFQPTARKCRAKRIYLSNVPERCLGGCLCVCVCVCARWNVSFAFRNE